MHLISAAAETDDACAEGMPSNEGIVYRATSEHQRTQVNEDAHDACGVEQGGRLSDAKDIAAVVAAQAGLDFAPGLWRLLSFEVNNIRLISLI